MIFHKTNKFSFNITWVHSRTLNVIPYFQDRASCDRAACFHPLGWNNTWISYSLNIIIWNPSTKRRLNEIIIGTLLSVDVNPALGMLNSGNARHPWPKKLGLQEGSLILLRTSGFGLSNFVEIKEPPISVFWKSSEPRKAVPGFFLCILSSVTCLKKPIFSKRDLLLQWKVPASLCHCF